MVRQLTANQLYAGSNPVSTSESYSKSTAVDCDTPLPSIRNRDIMNTVRHVDRVNVNKMLDNGIAFILRPNDVGKLIQRPDGWNWYTRFS